LIFDFYIFNLSIAFSPISRYLTISKNDDLPPKWGNWHTRSKKIRSPPGGGFLLIVNSLLLIVNTGQNYQNYAKNIVFSAPHLTNLYVFHIVNI